MPENRKKPRIGEKAEVLLGVPGIRLIAAALLILGLSAALQDLLLLGGVVLSGIFILTEKRLHPSAEQHARTGVRRQDPRER